MYLACNSKEMLNRITHMNIRRWLYVRHLLGTWLSLTEYDNAFTRAEQVIGHWLYFAFNSNEMLHFVARKILISRSIEYLITSVVNYWLDIILCWNVFLEFVEYLQKYAINCFLHRMDPTECYCILQRQRQNNNRIQVYFSLIWRTN